MGLRTFGLRPLPEVTDSNYDHHYHKQRARYVSPELKGMPKADPTEGKTCKRQNAD